MGEGTAPCSRAQYVAVQKRPTDAAKVVRGAGKKCVLGMHDDCGNHPGGRDTILEYPQVIMRVAELVVCGEASPFMFIRRNPNCQFMANCV